MRPANQNTPKPEYDWLIITVFLLGIGGMAAFWVGFLYLASVATNFLKP